VSLIERLTRGDSPPIVSVAAPAGYGKTTLLSQWAEAADQAVAWVSLDGKDNDPKVLLSYIAKALDEVQPVGKPVFDALASPASSVSGSVVPRLGAAFRSMTVPVLLVLDDVHLLHNGVCRSALSVLADHIPPGSRLVLAGRNEPPLRIPRLRAEGRILEISPGELALTPAEAASLLRAAEVVLGEEDVAELHRRTEGWAVGLYLAALYLREGGSMTSSAVSFDGGDRFVREYMQSELLEQVPSRQRFFLTRAAVLERMSAPLCEAVLDLPGAAPMLAELARSNLLLVPLDRRGLWYRYHHLFRDMLLAELERREPELIRTLRRRAAGWCLDNDQPEEALEYYMAAGDVHAAAGLVEKLAVPAQRQGRVATLERWFRWLDDRDGIEAHPTVAALAALIYAWMGRPTEADRWADVEDRWWDRHEDRRDDPAVGAWVALGRAFMCRHGIAQMLTDTAETVRLFSEAGILTAAPALMQGIALVLSGDLDSGDAALAEAAGLACQAATLDLAAEALGERSLIAMARRDWRQADDLAGQAHAVLRRARAEDSYIEPLIYAVQARIAIHHGNAPAAREHLVSAQRARPLLTYAIPHVAVQARIELTRVHLALADKAAATTLMREIDELLKRRPGLGILAGEAQQLRAQLGAARGPSTPGASALTAAELRVLPLLTTHLSMPEIAGELSLSPHTIKSQAYSIYRKLGASSRSEAVTRSRELALLEG
jgi:LuxR family maltose regulon positive regulatory protein